MVTFHSCVSLPEGICSYFENHTNFLLIKHPYFVLFKPRDMRLTRDFGLEIGHP